MNPLTLFTLHASMTTFLVETQTVIALRLMGMSGAIPARRGENSRMFAEKGPAMAKSYAAASAAVMAGQRPDQIMTAAMAPLSIKVRANRRRLLS